MQNTAYRLAEYKVIENEHGDLWWEIHIGLGSLKSGKCFIYGNILFIKPSDYTRPGFLKGEFLDHLNKLPKWKKTKYYCASYKIYECKSDSRKQLFDGLDSRLQNEAILRINRSTQREVSKTGRKSVKVDTSEHNSYKLHRYEIIENIHGQLFWKSHNGLVSSKAGRCHIEGNILFLEPGETKPSNLMKTEFLQQLFRLPDWEKTNFFCPSYAVYYSKTGAICRRLEEDKNLNIAGIKNVVVNHKTYGAGINIKPIIVNNGVTKTLTAFFSLCKQSVMLILKLLLGLFKIVYKISRALIDKWARFRG